MSSVTASATERDVATPPDGQLFYAAMKPTEETYTVEVTPTFDLKAELSGSTWIVRDRQTGIFGVGETVSEAVRDFGRAVREHLDVLERQDSLSEELRAQLQYLRSRAA